VNLKKLRKGKAGSSKMPSLLEEHPGLKPLTRRSTHLGGVKTQTSRKRFRKSEATRTKAEAKRSKTHRGTLNREKTLSRGS